MAHTTPRLDEPAPGWTHDLPGPNQPPSRTPFPSVLSNPPNHVDDVYLELACSTTRIRGIGLWGAVFILASAIYLAFFMIMLAANSPIHLPLEIGTAGLITVVISIWLGIYLYRIDVQAPRDEPIRFNRLRRKVYVYKFQHDGLRPFSRTAWGVRPAIYDWDDLHAEACRLYVPGTALIENHYADCARTGHNKSSPSLSVRLRNPARRDVLGHGPTLHAAGPRCPAYLPLRTPRLEQRRRELQPGSTSRPQSRLAGGDGSGIENGALTISRMVVNRTLQERTPACGLLLQCRPDVAPGYFRSRQ